MQKTNIEEVNRLVTACQSKERTIEELKKQLSESEKEDIKQEPDDHALTVKKLEELHNERVEDVLKDARNIKPYFNDSDWICDVIDKVSVDNI